MYKQVRASRLAKGHRIALFNHGGVYIIEQVERCGDYIDVTIQGVFYPVRFLVSQLVSVKDCARKISRNGL